MKGITIVLTLYVLNTLEYILGNQNLGFYMSGLVGQMFVMQLLQATVNISSEIFRKGVWIALIVYVITIAIVISINPDNDAWLHVVMGGFLTGLSLIELKQDTE